MTRPLYGSRLLRTAQGLAGVGAGRGRPALADLRRATSTAYYAVFHQVVRHSALDFLPMATEAETADIARWYTHTGVLASAETVVTAASSRAIASVSKTERTSVMAVRASSGGVVHRDLIVVADAIQTLQEARHSADYDGNYDPVRAVTINHVRDAETALRAMWSLWRAAGSPKTSRQSAASAYRIFLRLALLRPGGPRGR